MVHAQPRKRKRSPYWYVIHWCPKLKRRRWLSTKLRHDLPSNGPKILEIARKLSQEALALKPILDKSAWHVWAEPHLQERYGAKEQAKTKERMLRMWRAVELYFTEKGILGPTMVDANTPSDYVSWRTKNHPRRSGKFTSRNTAIMELKCISVLMAKAMKLGFVSANPIIRHGITRDPVEEKPEITDEEADRIRKALKSEPIWMQDSFDIGMKQGCRLSECATPLSRIDEKRGVITFRIKGGAMKGTRFHPDLVPILHRRRAEGARELVTFPKPELASKEWFLFFTKIGMPHLCFHCTRVTVITKLARAGVTQQQAMRYVLQASSTVHAIYTRLGIGDTDAAVKVL